MNTSTYPVHVEARLEPGLSRWQWLVKWLLVIPHYVVLAFLWLAFVVLSAIAFFAILLTGRYPRSIFDFNVGVLRWSWRVAFYAYGALATDRYPPFSLREVPDYPAHLDVEYPEQLSRGLVLVKWWLLAIPHYLIVGFFIGGGWYVADNAWDEGPWLWGGGLIGLLALVAAVVLLVTGSYPRPLFDLVLGLNRWVLRVAAYAALMTDQYPPFRLDQGGEDPDGGPGRLAVREPAPEPPTPSAPPPAPVTWTTGRVVALVMGSLVLVGSLGMGAGGITLAWADETMRDEAGYLMTDGAGLTTDGYALTSEDIDIDVGPDPGWLLPEDTLGNAKVVVTGDDAPVFVGIASHADADAYLAGVRHAVVSRLEPSPAYRTAGEGAPSAAPGDLDIWVVSSSGRGTRSVVWPVEEGDWTIVVMNADGSAGVTADVAIGVSAPALSWLVPVMLSVAGTGLVLAVVLLVIGLRPVTQPTGNPS